MAQQVSLRVDNITNFDDLVEQKINLFLKSRLETIKQKVLLAISESNPKGYLISRDQARAPGVSYLLGKIQNVIEIKLTHQKNRFEKEVQGAEMYYLISRIYARSISREVDKIRKAYTQNTGSTEASDDFLRSFRLGRYSQEEPAMAFPVPQLPPPPGIRLPIHGTSGPLSLSQPPPGIRLPIHGTSGPLSLSQPLSTLPAAASIPQPPLAISTAATTTTMPPDPVRLPPPSSPTTADAAAHSQPMTPDTDSSTNPPQGLSPTSGSNPPNDPIPSPPRSSPALTYQKSAQRARRKKPVSGVNTFVTHIRRKRSFSSRLIMEQPIEQPVITTRHTRKRFFDSQQEEVPSLKGRSFQSMPSMSSPTIRDLDTEHHSSDSSSSDESGDEPHVIRSPDELMTTKHLRRPPELVLSAIEEDSDEEKHPDIRLSKTSRSEHAPALPVRRNLEVSDQLKRLQTCGISRKRPVIRGQKKPRRSSETVSTSPSLRRLQFQQCPEIVRGTQEQPGREVSRRQPLSELRPSPVSVTNSHLGSEPGAIHDAIQGTTSASVSTQTDSFLFEKSLSLREFVDRFNAGSKELEESQKEALRILDSIEKDAWEYRDEQKFSPKTTLIARSRQAFCTMYECDDPEVKTHAMQNLIALLENDPLDSLSSTGLIQLQKSLLSFIRLEEFENINIDIQILVVKAMAISIECILLQASSDSLNAITPETKSNIQEGIGSLFDMNVKENNEINFWLEYAKQAAKRLTSSESEIQQWFKVLYDFTKAALSVASCIQQFEIEKLESTYDSLKKACEHLGRNESWFEEALLFKRRCRYALNNEIAFRDIIKQVQGYKQLQEYKESKNHLYLFRSVISTLQYVILSSSDQTIRYESMKLLLQYITIDEPQIQIQIISIFEYFFNLSKVDALTSYAVLLILKICNGISTEEGQALLDQLPAPKDFFNFISIQDATDLINFNGSHPVTVFLLKRLLDIKRDRNQDFGGESFETLIASSSNTELVAILLEYLFEFFPNSTRTNIYGDTSLHTATRLHNLTMIETISKISKIDPDAKEYRRGNTPMQLAAKLGFEDVISLLRRNMANPNIQNKEGDTALHIAVRKGRYDCVIALLENIETEIVEDYCVDIPMTDLSIINKHSQTPLSIAFEKDNVEIALLLMEREAELSEKRYHHTLIISAARIKSEKILRELLERHPRISELEASQILLMMCDDGETLTCSTAFAEYFLNKVSDQASAFSVAFLPFGHFPHPIKDQSDNIVIVRNPPSNSNMSRLIKSAEDPSQIEVLRELLETNIDINAHELLRTTALHSAAIAGNFEGVKAILEIRDDFTIDQRDAQGFTALHYAAARRHNPMIRLLISKGAKPQRANRFGDTPTHLYFGSFGHRKSNAMRLIVPDISFREQQYTIEEDAATHEKTVLELLTTGIIPSVDSFGNNWLYHAVCYDLDGSNIRFLCEKFPTLFWEKNIDGILPIEEALKKNKIDNVAVLITSQATDGLLRLHEELFDFTGNALPLSHLLASANLHELLDQLFESDSRVATFTDSSPYKYTPLHIAAQKGHSEIINVYVKYANNGISLDYEDFFGNTPLHIATIYREEAFAKTILLHETDNLTLKNKDGRTPVHLAAIKGSDNLLGFMLRGSEEFEFEGDPNAHLCADSQGNTPIQMACKYNRLPSLKLLFGIDPIRSIKDTNDDNMTLLLTAAQGGHNEIIHWLLSSMPDDFELHRFLEAQDSSGMTALSRAVTVERRDCVRTILHFNPDLEAGDYDGETPGHKAAFFCYRGIFRDILEKGRHLGMDPVNVKDLMDETPAFEPLKNRRRPSPGRPSLARSEILRIALDYGYNMLNANEKGETALHLAAMHGDRDVLDTAWRHIPRDKRKDAFSVKDNDGNTLLHKACAREYEYDSFETSAVGFLYNRYDLLNRKNKAKQTPLLLSVSRGDFALAKWLYVRGAKTERRNLKGENLLHIALKLKNYHDIDLFFKNIEEDIPELLKHVSQAEKQTPLHTMARYAPEHCTNLDAILDLLIGNLDGDAEKKEKFLSARDFSNRTAVEIATQRGLYDLASKIRSYENDRYGHRFARRRLIEAQNSRCACCFPRRVIPPEEAPGSHILPPVIDDDEEKELEGDQSSDSELEDYHGKIAHPSGCCVIC